MYGIEPPHRFEQRRREGLRLMVEERLVDLCDILVAILGVLANVYDWSHEKVKVTAKLAMQNKRYSVMALFAVAVIVAMVW